MATQFGLAYAEITLDGVVHRLTVEKHDQQGYACFVYRGVDRDRFHVFSARNLSDLRHDIVVAYPGLDAHRITALFTTASQNDHAMKGTR